MHSSEAGSYLEYLPVTEPLSSLCRGVLSALAHGFGEKMTFYDDIYPFYPLQRTSFIFSGSLLAVILVFLTLLVTLLLIVPGIRGRSVRALKYKSPSTKNTSLRGYLCYHSLKKKKKKNFRILLMAY